MVSSAGAAGSDHGRPEELIDRPLAEYVWLAKESAGRNHGNPSAARRADRLKHQALSNEARQWNMRVPLSN